MLEAPYLRNIPRNLDLRKLSNMASYTHYALDAGMQPYSVIDHLNNKLDLVITFAGPSKTATDGLWGFKLEVSLFMGGSPDRIVTGFGSATSQKTAKKKAAEAILREILNEREIPHPFGLRPLFSTVTNNGQTYIMARMGNTPKLLITTRKRMIYQLGQMPYG